MSTESTSLEPQQRSDEGNSNGSYEHKQGLSGPPQVICSGHPSSVTEVAATNSSHLPFLLVSCLAQAQRSLGVNISTLLLELQPIYSVQKPSSSAAEDDPGGHLILQTAL